MLYSFQRKFDAVIIGAGNGGLVAAAQLAIKGKKVLLLEQHNIIGGFSTSFVRGRFEFEASLHELCDVGNKENPGSIYNLFEELGVAVEWIPIPEAFRLILKEPRLDVTLPFGVKEFCDAFESYVPNSREKIEKFLSLAKEVLNGLNYLGESKGNPDKQVLIKNHPNLLKTAGYSVDEVCNALKMSQEIKNILYAYWCYLGIPTTRINFTIYAAMFYKYLVHGAYIPKYRSTEFALALEAKIREKGGIVECNSYVENILVENGKVVGVKTAHGEFIGSSHVACNASPNLVYSKMIHPQSEVPEKALQWVNARNLSVSGFVVFLGLDASPVDLGIKEYSYFIYDHIDTDRLHENFKHLGRPTSQATICLNNANPDCSPKGTTILSITILFKPEAWQNVKVEDYFNQKTSIANYLIENFEVATGIKIRDHIEEIEIAAPPTYAHLTNSYQGIIYGYEIDSWDSLLPRMMMIKEDEIIQGLKFVGGYGFRTIGYSSALLSGQTVALLTLVDIMKQEVEQ